MTRQDALKCAAAAAALLIWLLRYDVSTVSPGRAYVLDRWTGDVRVYIDRKVITPRPEE